MSRAKLIHVAAAVILNENDQVLLSLRPEHTHQGGLWEFPGGKLEDGEPVEKALQRELQEELGITPVVSRPLIRIQHDYGDRRVLLDVWRVDAFQGEAKGLEGQVIEWVNVNQLWQRPMPAADKPIIQSILLPDSYLITPEPRSGIDHFLMQLQGSLNAGTRLVQLRAHTLDDQDYRQLADRVAQLCHQYHATLLLNRALGLVKDRQAEGVHLNSQSLMSCHERPVAKERLLSASCHNLAEVQQAHHVGVDLIVAGPVQATQTHPEANPIGWQQFHRLCEAATMPVYALGGMQQSDRPQAFQMGGQGIAAIRSLWGEVP